MLKIQQLIAPSVQDFAAVRSLLNQYVSFGLMTESKLTELITYHAVIVAFEEGKLVGVATLSKAVDDWELSHIAVVESHRSRGIGASLLDCALVIYRHAQAGQAQPLPLKASGWTTPQGWSAEKLFLSKGFTIQQEDKDYWLEVCKSSQDCPHYTDKCQCSCKLVEYQSPK